MSVLLLGPSVVRSQWTGRRTHGTSMGTDQGSCLCREQHALAGLLDMG